LDLEQLKHKNTSDTQALAQLDQPVIYAIPKVQWEAMLALMTENLPFMDAMATEENMAYHYQEMSNPDIRTQYAKTEAEAKRKFREMKKTAYQETPEQRRRQTVGKYILDWFPRYKKGLKPASYDRQENSINHQITRTAPHLCHGAIQAEDRYKGYIFFAWPRGRQDNI